MPIYLMFLQHIMFSLKKNGKAAVVVPTGFITAKTAIELKIRERLMNKKFIHGVISMPSNIFATTGTNVSIIFIDKSKNNDKVLLIDGSKLGEKIKDGKNQKTILRPNEINKIINCFINKEVIDDFSVIVDSDEIIKNNYSLSAGEYFEIKVKYSNLTKQEFDNVMTNYKNELLSLINESNNIEKQILSDMERCNYDEIREIR